MSVSTISGLRIEWEGARILLAVLTTASKKTQWDSEFNRRFCITAEKNFSLWSLYRFECLMSTLLSFSLICAFSFFIFKYR